MKAADLPLTADQLADIEAQARRMPALVKETLDAATKNARAEQKRQAAKIKALGDK